MQNPLTDEMLGFHGYRIITANSVCPSYEHQQRR
jgi:hypothetical protein